MKLVVFDLDGTLARTSAVDETCFVQAFAEALDIHRLSTNWLDYDHATDSAVARQAIVKHLGREPEEREIAAVIDRFVELLQSHHASDASLFTEVAGASALLTHLQQSPDWGVALATGGWKRSARFKIQSASLPLDGVPAAFAEDGPSREEIIQTAIARASTRYRAGFDKIISVGDAVWDIRSARLLRLPFLGIADEPRATLLRENGASHVAENFLDQAQCLHWLNNAATPRDG